MKYIVLILIACALVSGFYFYSHSPSDDTRGALPKDILSGTDWLISSVSKDASGIEESTLSLGFILSFEEGKKLAGKICNSFSGPYVENGPSFVATQIISTKMACDESIMGYENLLLDTLHQGVTYRMDGANLVMSGVSGLPVFFLSPRAF